MTRRTLFPLTPMAGAMVAATILASGAIGYGVARFVAGAAPATISAVSPASGPKILYWYDPMIPAEHHDGPGLSSMGMKTIPKYADEGSRGAEPGVRVDPAAV